jgi:ribosomal-protein-alanine N-acetyltransferase
VRLEIEPMGLPDLDAVREIERRSFSTPWPAHAYPAEIETNRLAHYRVARLDGRIVAFAGIWLMLDEAHVTTFAVDPEFRRRSIGERLLLAMLDVAIDKGAREATLEVRLSNIAARRLYEKYGFRPVGLRPRYYSDDNEDALIMTTEPLGEPAMRERLARLRTSLEDESGMEAAAGAGAADEDGPGPGPEDPTR